MKHVRSITEIGKAGVLAIIERAKQMAEIN